MFNWNKSLSEYKSRLVDIKMAIVFELEFVVQWQSWIAKLIVVYIAENVHTFFDCFQQKLQFVLFVKFTQVFWQKYWPSLNQVFDISYAIILQFFELERVKQ